MSKPAMADLAALARRALRDDPTAPGEFMEVFPVEDHQELYETMLKFAEIPSEQVDSWEHEENNYVLLDGRWGRFWLVPKYPRRVLLPPAPMISVRALRALGLGVVDMLATS